MSAIGWVLLACFGFVGVLGALLFLAYRLGGADEREDRAEDAADAKQDEVDRRVEPVLVGPARYNRLRRTWARLRRVQDRTTEP